MTKNNIQDNDNRQLSLLFSNSYSTNEVASFLSVTDNHHLGLTSKKIKKTTDVIVLAYKELKSLIYLEEELRDEAKRYLEATILHTEGKGDKENFIEECKKQLACYQKYVLVQQLYTKLSDEYKKQDNIKDDIKDDSCKAILDSIKEEINKSKTISRENLELFSKVEQEINYQIIKEDTKTLSGNLGGLGLTCLPNQWINENKDNADLTQLSIEDNNLTNLPEDIGNLTLLQNMYLDKNYLTSLPNTIGSLDNLSELSLIDNNLEILPEALGELTALKSLYLSNNNLEKLPDIIGQLIALERLHLTNNNIASLPESICNLRALWELYLNDNNLEGLPESLGNLASLQYLYLEDNNLETLPENICNITVLKYLYLDHNNLEGLPESLGNLRALKRLYITDNHLTSVPESIGNLKSLKYLYLDDNNLPSLPNTIGSLNLKGLNLMNNPFLSVSDFISNLQNQGMTVLYDGNSLSNLSSESKKPKLSF